MYCKKDIKKIQLGVIIGFILLNSIGSILASSVTETPSSWTDVTSNWTYESGVQSSGGTAATNTASNGQIIYYDFDVQVPYYSWVTTCSVNIKWKTTLSLPPPPEWPDSRDKLDVYFSNDSGTTWSSVYTITSTNYYAYDEVECTDLTWDHLSVNNFRVKLIHNKEGSQVEPLYIDHIEQIVDYISGPPDPQEPDECRSPSDFTDSSSEWIGESQAYAPQTAYCTGSDSGYSVFFYDFDWSVPTTQDIEDVTVYVHWKTVIDDDLKVKIHWNGGSSSWYEFTAETSWTLESHSFGSATDWTAALVNDDTNFKVEIQKETNNADDAVLIDWVGTKVDYYDVRVEDVSATGSFKGINQSFIMKFKNYGTLASGTSINASIKIETSNYSDYDTWVDKEFSYTLSSSLDYLDESTYYQRDFPYVFEGHDSPTGGSCDGWFAMNVGIYDITDVYLYTSSWNTTTSLTNEGFYVTQSSTHEVFCVVMLESDFEGNLTDSGLDIYSYFEKCNKFAIVNETNDYNYTQGLYQLISQELKPVLVFDWDPDMFGSMTSYYQDASIEAASLLNLDMHYWPALSSTQNNSLGTPTQGHGFDLLYALEAQEDVGGGVCVNKSIVFHEWFESYGLYSTICAFIHETCHVYGAKDLYNSTIYPDISDVIMDGAENWESGHYSSVQIHPITFERITLNLVRFDGPS